ncbi:spermidine synthase [Rhodopseudomonas sp. HC1]|uniref:spermidine synthase n=1 Tax=Rhodopseudomonas infernalis TaxID=2897386 RepID=UPI001EE93A57|nr:spermidine synthase [Rhodopseudomonas infernalis]MCG6203512.1 spermidine synthase [Rhodopseudomonas infernalis]
MLPWIKLATAQIPGGDELRLMQRGEEFSIKLGANELMNSRLGGSEEALATLACRKLAGRTRPHVLIGGLGMGFTLRAALAVFGKDATIDVAELVPEVIDWGRGPMAALYGNSLDDPRVNLIARDVGELIQAGAGRFDAILLDVDNGPEGLSRKANDRLYDHGGLATTRAALRDGGVLALWSSGPDEGFTRRLRQSGFTVNEVPIRAVGKRSGSRHWIWLAVRS